MGLLALFDPLLWITLLVWSFLFFKSLVRGIMDLYEKRYGVVIWTVTAAMFGTLVIHGLSTIFTVWFVTILSTIVQGYI